MKYSVKLILRHTAETGEVFIEQSIIMLTADSFDDAYAKAEQYVKENEISSDYTNMYGKQVKTEVISYADCYWITDEEDVTEVYSSIVKCREDLTAETITSVFEESCTREDMLPLRQWPDPEHPEERNNEY